MNELNKVCNLYEEKLKKNTIMCTPLCMIQNSRQTCIRQIGNIDFLIAYNIQFPKMYRFANLQKNLNEITLWAGLINTFNCRCQADCQV